MVALTQYQEVAKRTVRHYKILQQNGLKAMGKQLNLQR